MGITTMSLNRLNKHLKKDDSILMIGCQNLYNSENYGQIAHGYFSGLGYKIRTIDILGCQGSETADLREDLGFKPEYNIVADFGSKEHIDGELYQAFKNIHEACALDGVMIHENPKTGNWPLHGQHYFTTGFYEALAQACDYDLEEVSEEPAMGNWESGMNVCAVLIKRKDDPFISKTKFNNIYKKHIHAK